MIASHEFTEIGTYWEKGNQNEIDIVAINEIEQKLVLAEVKLNKQKISIPLLRQKAKGIAEKLEDYKIVYVGFSLEDM